MAKTWENTYEYRRILEILDDYWLSEPDEDKVVITMEFYKGNECQKKQIRWINPNKKGEQHESI